MGARRLVRPSRRAGGSGGGALLLAGIAAVAGVGLIAGSNRKKQLQPDYERVGADELPAIGDFERELEASGGSVDVTQEGEMPRLEEGDDGVRIEVIDTVSEPARKVS